jgi:hypothetical protein
MVSPALHLLLSYSLSLFLLLFSDPLLLFLTFPVPLFVSPSGLSRSSLLVTFFLYVD